MNKRSGVTRREREKDEDLKVIEDDCTLDLLLNASIA
jgi:hypothetical protein